MIVHIAFQPSTSQWMMHALFNSPEAVKQYLITHKLDDWEVESFGMHESLSQQLKTIIDLTVNRAHNRYLEKVKEQDRKNADIKLQAAIQQAAKDGNSLARKLMVSKEAIDLYEQELKIKWAVMPEVEATIKAAKDSITPETEHIVKVKIAPVERELQGMKERITFLCLELKELRPDSAVLKQVLHEQVSGRGAMPPELPRDTPTNPALAALQAKVTGKTV